MKKLFGIGFSLLLLGMLGCEDYQQKYEEDFGDTDWSEISTGDDDNAGNSVNGSSSSQKNGTATSSSSKTVVVNGFTYGLMTDERDGKTYKTIKIGDLVWMAENLNLKIEDESQSLTPTNSKVYGMLYSWPGAVGRSEKECGYDGDCDLKMGYNENGELQGICPDGWHLPSYDEFNQLVTIAKSSERGGTALKAKSGWVEKSASGHYGYQGTDAYGFNAIPAGFMAYSHVFSNVHNVGDRQYIEEPGTTAVFWSSTQIDEKEAVNLILLFDEYDAFLSRDHKESAFSIRCVKNTSNGNGDFCGGVQFDKSTEFCGEDRNIYERCKGVAFDPELYVCYAGVLKKYCGTVAYDTTKYVCDENNQLSKRCGEVGYDSTKYSCESASLSKLCGTVAYDTSAFFCGSDTKVYEKCGGVTFEVSKSFCFEETVYSLCDSKTYDASRQFCGMDKKIYSLCNGKTFDVSSEFCGNDNAVHDLCGGEKYDLSKFTCVASTLKPLCGTESYDPEKFSCVSGSIKPLCGSVTYDASTQFCDGTALFDLCGGVSYKSSTEFCSDNQIYGKCGGKSYDPAEYACSGSTLMPLCGEAIYDAGKKFCVDGTLYNLCGSSKYAPATEFCSGSSIYSKCNGEIFDPEKYVCVSKKLIALCGSVSYDETTHFCGSDKKIYPLCDELTYDGTKEFCGSDSKIHSLCGGKSFDVEVYFCGNRGSLVTLCAGKSYDTGDSACVDDVLYPLCGGKTPYDPEDGLSCVAGVVKGSFIDSRDGKVYGMVKIGSQIWMSENLNYEPDEGNVSLSLANSTYPEYKRFYSWSGAMDSLNTVCGDGRTCSVKKPFQGVCPSGWHLPTVSEWNELETAAGGAYPLMTKTGWYVNNGSDMYGFSIQAAGYYYGQKPIYVSYYNQYRYDGFFWTADEYDEDSAYDKEFTYNYSGSRTQKDEKKHYYSVRCVRN